MLFTSKRDFIKSLFVAPAIVTSTNIMPVKAIERAVSVENFVTWALTVDIYGNKMWMRRSDALDYVNTKDVLLERKFGLNLNIGSDGDRTRNLVKTMQELRSIDNCNVVTSPLPMHYKKAILF